MLLLRKYLAIFCGASFIGHHISRLERIVGKIKDGQTITQTVNTIAANFVGFVIGQFVVDAIVDAEKEISIALRENNDKSENLDTSIRKVEQSMAANKKAVLTMKDTIGIFKLC